MSHKPRRRLLWKGQSTLRELRELVWTQVDFELELPPDYHFALFRHLYPHAANGPEPIDVSGGAELIDKVAEIGGLNELAELAVLVDRSHAQVQILSPGPAILIGFPADQPS